MKYNLYTVSLICAVLLFSCSSRRSSLADSADNVSHFTLTKTPCFGTCPVYTMQIDKNCIVTLEATQHVPKDMEGWYSANLPEKEWHKLARMLKDMEFENLQENYGSKNITDLPSTLTSVTFQDGKTVKVDDYGNRGTPQLTALYAHIDMLLTTLEWESTDGGAPQSE